jgi:hypothetical protein
MNKSIQTKSTLLFTRIWWRKELRGMGFLLGDDESILELDTFHH